MASLTILLGVFVTLLCCSSALRVPAFCNTCEENVRNPYCVYCCAKFSCCGTEQAVVAHACHGHMYRSPPEGRDCTVGYKEVQTVRQDTPKEECKSIKCPCKTTDPEDGSNPTETPTASPKPPKPRDCKMKLDMSRILGGSTVKVCDRPWMVHFKLDMPGVSKDANVPMCSGVLIDATMILTSKTCYEQFETLMDMDGVSIHAQFADSENELALKRDVKKTNIKEHGDLVVITITKVPIDRDFCIYPVCLPEESTVFPDKSNLKCRIASWGYKEPSKPSSAGVLEEADVSLMSPDFCKDLLPILDQLDIKIPAPKDGGLCTNPQNAKTSTCQDDQGGMLMCKDTAGNWLLSGIAYGTPCDPKKPSTFVDINTNMEFITSKLKEAN